MIVDENTGRVMPGRRWSDGLHQAVEAKEGVTIERETRTYATITIQNYFRMYEKLAGMTGTAETEATEFNEIYRLAVQVIPTNKPCIRIDRNDSIFKTRRDKYNAVVREIEDGEQARPAGPRRHDERRVLGGAFAHAPADGHHPHRPQRQVPPAGGRNRDPGRPARRRHDRDQHGRPRNGHQAGRGRPGAWAASTSSEPSGTSPAAIDRQLRGRCSRQGDPGLTKFFLSLEDDLMRLFLQGNLASRLMEGSMQEGEELEHPRLNRSIEAIVQQLSGKPYWDYMRQHVFAPACMSRTGFYTRPQVLALNAKHELAHPYSTQRTGGPACPPLRRPHLHRPPGRAAGGRYTTTPDLLSFATALQDGTLLNPAYAELILNGKFPLTPPASTSPTWQSWISGYGLEDTIINNQHVLGHSGNGPGIAAGIYIYPDLNLAERGRSGTALSAGDQALAEQMIEDSDNDAATSLWDEVGGASSIRSFNTQAGLADTSPSPCVTCAGFPWPGWGLTTTVPSDQLTLLRELVEPNSLLSSAERSYALSLMENVTPGQRWGVSGGVPAQATVALKNGWLPLTSANNDWQINSVGWISGSGRDYLMAVLTTGNPTEQYGIDTIDQLGAMVWNDMG